MSRPRAALSMAAVATLMASHAAVKPPLARALTVRPGPHRAVARFAIGYVGSGSYATTYESHPPNQGGKPDHNHAHDSSTQSWSLSFTSLLSIPTCAAASAPGDPCSRIGPISGARGHTTVTGRISHVHVDGLFRDENMATKCRVSASTPAGYQLGATIDVRYNSLAGTISLQAMDPVANALILLPSACRNPVDGIDGLYGNYFGPGFSFNPAYGADRWFTSRTVVISTRELHRAALIQIPLSETRAGTPPPSCDVPEPSYEHCTTGGSWRGVLTLRAHR